MSNDDHSSPPDAESAKRAVALEYTGLGAPRVTAKGDDALARALIEAARAHGIPIHEDPGLVHLLASVELGQEVPRDLYVAISEVLAFAYWLSGKPVPPRLD